MGDALPLNDPDPDTAAPVGDTALLVPITLVGSTLLLEDVGRAVVPTGVDVATTGGVVDRGGATTAKDDVD